jgi:hypothetical protein
VGEKEATLKRVIPLLRGGNKPERGWVFDGFRKYSYQAQIYFHPSLRGDKKRKKFLPFLEIYSIFDLFLKESEVWITFLSKEEKRRRARTRRNGPISE